MAQITGDQWLMLRERLLAWALAQDTTAEETLTEQIDHLLEDVLHETPLAEPLPLLLEEPEADHRVVVTGLGLITPFGIGIIPFWGGLEAGASAITRITLCDTSGLPCQIAGEVKDFRPHDFMDVKDARRMSRSSQFAVAAARLALTDAALRVNEDNSEEIGVLIACGSMSLPETEEAVRTLVQRGTDRISPFYLPIALPHMPACQVAIQVGVRGHTTAISTAGAASTQAIGEAAAIIRRGDANVMLAGGTEAPISRLGIGGFCAMRVVSTRNDEPERASRPFDAQRDGFVPAEGAAVLVLERLSHARQRGATIYAEVAGYACTSDAHHMLTPHPTGAAAARAIRRALMSAGSSPQQVDYMSAHATGTPLGDVAETVAIKQALDEYAFSVPVSATKSMLGHMLGAAGAVQAATAVLAIERGILPPTINQEYPDPDCDLDYVPNTARPARIQTVISNSFDSGGVNAVLVFRQLDDSG